MVSQLDNLNRLLMAYRVTYCDGDLVAFGVEADIPRARSNRHN